MIALALRNLLARKRRTLLTALAIIVGVAQVTGAFILTDSMNRSVDTLFDTGQQGIDVSVTPRGNETGGGPEAHPERYDMAGAYVGVEPPEGFAIKGNERSMKYHLPDSNGWARTIAEVWFSSEEAAQQAGFTKAQH